MTTIWNDVGDRFLEFLRELSTELGAPEKGFRVAVDRYANESFPLRAGVSFSPLSAPGDEQLVISLDVKRSGDALEGTVDIARGDGLVLAEQQVLEAPEAEVGSEKIRELAHTAEQAAEDFLQAHAKLLSSELETERSRDK